MNYPSFTHRGFVAVGHPKMLANGKIDGNFAIHTRKPFGEVVHRTQRMAECETRAEALENMCVAAEAWIEAHLSAGK